MVVFTASLAKYANPLLDLLDKNKVVQYRLFREVIVMVLSVALVHLDTIFGATDTRMEDTERVSIAVLQCFNAHCYVMDEACPMKYWQSNIYSSYCNVKVLNSASYKLLKLLKYNLSVTEDEVAAQTKYLLNEAVA